MRTWIARGLLVALLAVPAMLGAAGPATPKASPPAAPPAGSATRTAVQAFVKAYVDAANRADITAMMEMMSRKEGVATIGDGEIERGWEAIRQGNDDMVGSEGSFKISVGSIDVMPLGSTAAVAMAPISTTLATATGAVQATGAMTLVLVKTAGKWLIVHEHVSHQVPETEPVGD